MFARVGKTDNVPSGLGISRQTHYKKSILKINNFIYKNAHTLKISTKNAF